MEKNKRQGEKILYLECSSGISGDMTVGALLDLGASREALEKALSSLGVDGYHLHFGRTKKCGIDAFRFDVHLEDHGHDHDHDHDHHHDHDHEHDHDHSHEHEHDHEHGHHHDHDHDHSHEHDHDHDHDHHHDHDHSHDHDHEHDHDHGHHHHHHHDHPHVHRNLGDILEIIERLDAAAEVKELAARMFRIVAEAESKAHGLPVEEVHFHEVGAVDSIVDIVGAAVCIYDLGISRVVVSALSEGSGYVLCQHGLIPVPVPATVNIASRYGLVLKSTDNEGEMVTPTGAAIAAALRTEEKLPDRYTIDRIGLGAGKKDFSRPNVLRAMVLTPAEEAGESENLWVLETNLDDCTGEALGFAMELLWEKGAKDVWYTPVYMKKNRPAYVLSVLCQKDQRELMEEIIFSATTTIGIRRYPVERTALPRESCVVSTRYGEVRVKKCRMGEKVRCYPEYESVKELCRREKLDFPEVLAKIMADAAEEEGKKSDGTV